MRLEDHSTQFVAGRDLVAEEFRVTIVDVGWFGFVQATHRGERHTFGCAIAVTYPEDRARRRVVHTAKHVHQQVALLNGKKIEDKRLCSRQSIYVSQKQVLAFLMHH